jgi:hypothetical protein
MKLKGLTKLALSGVALAAVAATLGTSTYAWYVTNSTATVDGIHGTAKAGGLGNVLVAQASTEDGAVNGHGEFMQAITLDSKNITATAASVTGLIPATPVKDYDSTKATQNQTSLTPSTFVTTDSTTTWVDKEGKKDTSSAAKYIAFSVWVLSTDKTKVNMSYTIENTTLVSDLTKQMAYAATGLPSVGSTKVAQGSTFSVNMVDALRMAVNQTDYDSANQVKTSPISSTILDVAASATSSTYGTASGTVTSANFTTGGDANSYYKAVLGSASDIIENGVTATTGIDTTVELTVGANLETKLDFIIWLEGPDAQCFDSCSGQSFKINLTFETTQQG